MEKKVIDINSLDNETLFNYEQFKKLNMNDEEKSKWLDICKQIYVQDLTCANLEADQCVDSSFIHKFLTRDEYTQEIILKARECPKGRLQNNYLVRQFAPNKLKLSLLNDKKEFALKPDEEKINNYLLDSIKNNYITGFYFFGDVGIGKTHKIISYCNDMIVKNNRTVAYAFLPEMVRQMRDNFSLDNLGNKQLVDDCCNADILVLDDFGSEYTNAWFYLNFLLIILNYRCETEKPVIFVSNFTYEKMVQILESRMKGLQDYKVDKDFQQMSVKRLTSRLKQLVSGRQATFVTESRRK